MLVVDAKCQKHSKKQLESLLGIATPVPVLSPVNTSVAQHEAVQVVASSQKCSRRS